MIGTQWESPQGLRVVESVYDETRFLVRTGNERFRDIMDSDDIAKAQRIDASNIAFRAKQEAAREEREAQERARIAACPLEQYLATLSPMNAGRQRKSLTMLTRVNSGPVMTRAAAILELRAQGYRVEGDRICKDGVAGYFTKDSFTGFGLEFARFLDQRGIPAA